MLKANIAAGYVSQIYVMAASILCIPTYIEYLGVASYGLVGFFAALQGWFSLLDMGLIPTIARESSRYQAGVITALDFRKIYRLLSSLFILIAIFVGGLLWLQAENIVENWLKIDGVDVSQVKYSVQAMAVCIALRWFSGLYKGILTGAEKLVSLALFNIGIGSARYFGVILAMLVYGNTPSVFFTYQLVIAGLEVFGLYLINIRMLPIIRDGEVIGWSLKPIIGVLKFSATISFATFIWIANTQSDKLILSGILSLEEYGFFTSATLVASGINLLTAPISTSLMPNLTRLYSQKNSAAFISLYRSATQWVVIVAGSAAAVLIFLGNQLIFAWSGSKILADNTQYILTLYGIGNWILSVSAFGYYLQYSRGELRYHLIGNMIFILLYLPALIHFSDKFGGVGAGYVWVFSNLAYLITWIALIHKKFEPGLHNSWLMIDVFLPACVMIAFSWTLSNFIVQSSSRIVNLFEVIIFGILVFIMGAMVTRRPREFVLMKIRKLNLIKY